MNSLRFRSLILAGGLLLGPAPALLAQAAPATPAAPAPAARTGDRFERTKQHIDLLLKQRLKPVPLPTVLPNPFQSVVTAGGPGQGVPLTPDQPIEPEKPLTDDDEILGHYAATLKISGQMMLNGAPHLIINSSPYKEGSLLQAKGRGDTTYYLKIVKIAPGELTLGYNNAVLTIPLK